MGARNKPKTAFRCEYCQKEFLLNKRLKQHRKIHLARTEFQCSFCNFMTNFKQKLYSHIRSHTKERPFKCQQPNCKMAFSNRSNLTQHQLVHRKDNQSLRILKCPKCPYESIWRPSLKTHLKTHSDHKPFSCDLCPFKTKLKGKLKAHRNKIHDYPELKPFKCPNSSCSYSCKDAGSLKRHVQIHQAVKSRVCAFPNCMFKTKWKSALKGHAVVHCNDRPFNCNLCTSTFKTRSSLVAHIRGHTGETPYPCQRCSYRGKRPTYLKEHVERHHSEKTSSSRAGVSSSNQSENRGRFPAKCKVSGCNFAAGSDLIAAMHLNASHLLPRVVIKTKKTEV